MEKMLERNISRSEIELIVNMEIEVLVYPSSRDSDLDLYYGCIGDKYLMVVHNRVNDNLITTRAMRKDEKRLFKEVFKYEK